MGDPFRIDGPCIINVSGGRTSALMLCRYLDANGGRLPAEAYAVFTNTAKERPETYAFLARIASKWGVNMRWLERDSTAPGKFREVDFATASRNGEPFDQLIRERKFLPHAMARSCTVEMKIETARAFMVAQGHDEWTSAVGLRYDEPKRVHRLRGDTHGHDNVTVRCPLFDARITKADVMEFWRAQPFDLGLQPWQSNCAGCFLRSAATLERVERDDPGTLAWWHEWEERMGATFYKGRRYLSIIERARMPTLPGLDLDPEASPDVASLDCNCTD